MAASRTNVTLLPGNHDRYSDNFGTPGGDQFDRVFHQYWQQNEYVVAFKTPEQDGSALAFVFVDFSLQYTTDADDALSRYGQGRVTDERFDLLVNKTQSILDNHRNTAVIWVIHFPPRFPGVSPSLRLIDDERVLQAARDYDIQVILAGHTHRWKRYSPQNGLEIFCAGTATSWDKQHGNSMHFLELDVAGGRIRGFDHQNYFWDQARGNFVPSP